MGSETTARVCARVRVREPNVITDPYNKTTFVNFDNVMPLPVGIMSLSDSDLCPASNSCYGYPPYSCSQMSIWRQVESAIVLCYVSVK